jgi:stress response protein YsnF
VLPSIRKEGDSLVILHVEEVVKVERYFILKEEVRVRRVRATERCQEKVTLRKQEAVVTRLPIAKLGASLAETQTDLNSYETEKQTHEL